MALRFMLVSLVVVLGIDLPSGDDVSTWVRSGKEWVQARIDGAFGASEVTERSTVDADFAAIVDRMADSFTADLAATGQSAARRKVAFAPIEVLDGEEPGVADTLNRDAQGEGRAPEPVAIRLVKERPTASDSTPPVGAVRLASAVRLTGRAAAAWWTVLRGMGTATIAR